MKLNPRVLTYQDEVLADGSLRRSFSDGRYEWRRRLPDGRVEWQDSQGYSGVDELLGDRIIKRTFAQGQVVYAREQGYGRTLWHGGRVLTVNQTSFGGRVGMILASMGAGFLLGSLIPPPEFLSPEQEEMLRQQVQQQQQSSIGSGGRTPWNTDYSNEQEPWLFEEQEEELALEGDDSDQQELELVEQASALEGDDFGDDFDIGDFG